MTDAQRKRLEDRFAAERRKRGGSSLDDARRAGEHAANDLREAGAHTAAEQIERGLACFAYAARSLVDVPVPDHSPHPAAASVAVGRLSRHQVAP